MLVAQLSAMVEPVPMTRHPTRRPRPLAYLVCRDAVLVWVGCHVYRWCIGSHHILA